MDNRTGEIRELHEGDKPSVFETPLTREEFNAMEGVDPSERPAFLRGYRACYKFHQLGAFPARNRRERRKNRSRRKGRR